MTGSGGESRKDQGKRREEAKTSCDEVFLLNTASSDVSKFRCLLARLPWLGDGAETVRLRSVVVVGDSGSLVEIRLKGRLQRNLSIS